MLNGRYLLALLPFSLAATAYGQAPMPPAPPTLAPRKAAPAPQPAAPPPAAPVAPAPPPVGAAAAAPKPGERKIPEPPGAAEPPPNSMDAIAKATDVPYRPLPGGQLVKFNLQDADLAELVNHISGLTGKRFIYGPRVRQIKVTVVSPTPVSLEEAYEAFLAILQANGMTVVPHGRFLKIVDTGGVVAESTPVYSRAAPVPDTASFVTRLYRLKNVSPTEVSTLLQKFKSKEGDISVYEPGQLLILTDSGANIQRMVRLIEEVDVGGENAKMWIEPIHYGNSGDIAKQINDIFELGGPGGAGGKGGNAEGLMRVAADEQTNSLIVVGSEDAYVRLLDLLRRIDTAPAAEGRIHVLELQHAVAEELAQVLTQMLAGTGQKGGQGNAIADMFEGEVRVTPDKATNSLVITSSARDFAQLRLVIAKLDMPRRQVFIEAVIMDVSIDRTTDLGLAYHGGFTENLGGGSDTIFVGGFRPLTSVIPGPNELQGLALGVRGPDLEGTQNAFPALAGVSIPAFGVILNAIARSGDANILATPHIIATDNVPAEINVGENIPLQENFPSLGSLTGLLGATGTGTNTAAATGLSALGGLGGLGALGGFGSSQRQDVGTKIKVTPHINDKNQVRLEIEEEISERGAASGTLGAVSITQRNANTTLVVDDQQTVVIGGLMRDTLEKSREKIPVLGDLPVLGFLFRTSHVRKRKTNLLLILTPYVIMDQSDLRKVFERKMQERQEFLDRYFVFTSDWEPPKDFSRTNGLVEEIRQAYFAMEERLRLEEESKPGEIKEHVPTVALELPSAVRIGASTQAVRTTTTTTGGGGGQQAGAGAPGVAPGQQGQGQGQGQAPRRRRREGQGPGGGAAPGGRPAPSPGLQRPGPAPVPRPGQQGSLSPIRISPVSRSLARGDE